VLYTIIFIFGADVAMSTPDPFGRLLAVGVLALLAAQIFINIGMTMGLMPITGMTLPLISYGGSSLLVNGIALGLLLNVGGTFVPLADAVLGAALGYLSLWLVFQVFRLLTGKEGMGYGDFKLFALFGAWLGWQMLPLILLLSSLVGAVVGLGMILLRGRDRQQPIPFGPYLAVAGAIALFWGEAINRTYLQFAGIA